MNINMSSCVALIIFTLLCLNASLHACNARHLPHHHHQQKEQENNNNNNNMNNGAIHALKHKNPLMMIQQQHHDQPSIDQGGNDLTTKPYLSSSHTDQLFKRSSVEFTNNNNNNIKGENEKGKSLRSMLGYDEEDVNANNKENKRSNEEDIDMMDYAQPHRKPPIHNQRP
ncbi:uncharacterized protein LOC115716929 [Cannabis sativa]|uniref:uncharacterized protein LOC115716929 n=1 Tax=Cannabis sativa TaxID=3483 RepID=UPI0029CA177F|nr:uncharacterized protein LOC115716929 [Cannabis sativa]